MSSTLPPRHLDLQRRKGLTVEWQDGRTCFYPVGWLRRMSPSADQRELREKMESNPLTVLPTNALPSEELTAERIELVGNYAIRIHFSDGHSTGIYSWEYLQEIQPGNPDS